MLGMSDFGERTPCEPSATQPCGVAHPYFTRRVDAVLNAKVVFTSTPHFPRPLAAAAKAGVRFEARVVSTLSEQYRQRFISNLPFTFKTCSAQGKAIPDGLLFSSNGSEASIVEIKLRHSGDAWWQLERFYLPIVREALRVFRITAVEVVKHFDPWVKLPKQVALLGDIDEVFTVRECFHPVLVVGREGLRNGGRVA